MNTDASVPSLLEQVWYYYMSMSTGEKISFGRITCPGGSIGGLAALGPAC
jgi:hypothetical protein